MCWDEKITGSKLSSVVSAGNLHINICADKYDIEIEKVIEPYIYELVGA